MVKGLGEDATYLFPKSLLSFLPALYGWQVYGWPIALTVFALVYLLLVALGWTYVLTEWPFRRLVWARSLLVILSFIVIGLSTMETCSNDGICNRVFG